jgi:hypothetical protein
MGEIRCYPVRKGFRADAYYRDYDGVTRLVARMGATESKARSRLKEACRDRGRTDAAADITRDTTVKALAEEWFSEVRLAVEMGERSPGTGTLYRDRLDNQVIPAFGALRLREITVPEWTWCSSAFGTATVSESESPRPPARCSPACSGSLHATTRCRPIPSGIPPACRPRGRSAAP